MKEGDSVTRNGPKVLIRNSKKKKSPQ